MVGHFHTLTNHFLFLLKFYICEKINCMTIKKKLKGKKSQEGSFISVSSWDL